MPFDHAVIGSILERASNADQFLNGCTIQLWGGANGQAPVVFANIRDGNGNPMRDGSKGLVLQTTADQWPGNVTRIGGGSGPTKLYIGDRNNDQVLRLTPADDHSTYLCWHTCGGSCGWYPFRVVVNVRGSGPGDSTAHFKARFSTKGADAWRAGSVVLEATTRPGFFVGGATKPPNQYALHTGWMGESQAYMRIGFVALGPDLAQAYYKRQIETSGAAQVACCQREYREDVNTRDACARHGYDSGSRRCDEAVAVACATPGTTDPLCGCSENHAVIRALPTTSRALRQVRSFPQCFIDTCTHRDAYKFSNMRKNDGGVDCPNITICEQNLTLAQKAQLEDSGIVQDCAGNAADGGGGSGAAGGGNVAGGAGGAGAYAPPPHQLRLPRLRRQPGEPRAALRRLRARAGAGKKIGGNHPRPKRGAGAGGAGGAGAGLLMALVVVSVGTLLAGIGALHYGGFGTGLYVVWTGVVLLGAFGGGAILLTQQG